MEAIRSAFERLARSERKALIPFVMGGDPRLSMTGDLLLTLEDAGADLIEVGIPFSDPLADGPTIQGASARALSRGATPLRILKAIASVRQRVRVPIICLSYWNPLIQFGNDGHRGSMEAFARAAREHGVSGLIVPDLPVEEADSFRRASAREGLALIFLAAPTSPPQRLRMIARASEGFIYYVSLTGTTGARRSLPPSLVEGVRQLKLVTTKPVCVGFGISTGAQARTVARIADGVIVGSALIRELERSGGGQSALKRAGAFVKRLSKAVHG